MGVGAQGHGDGHGDVGVDMGVGTWEWPWGYGDGDMGMQGHRGRGWYGEGAPVCSGGCEEILEDLQSMSLPLHGLCLVD